MYNLYKHIYKILDNVQETSVYAPVTKYTPCVHLLISADSRHPGQLVNFSLTRGHLTKSVAHSPLARILIWP